MMKVEPVTPVTPRLTGAGDDSKSVRCNHEHWRIYNSLGYRECDKCGEKRPIFNVVKHQR